MGKKWTEGKDIGGGARLTILTEQAPGWLLWLAGRFGVVDNLVSWWINRWKGEDTCW